MMGSFQSSDFVYSMHEEQIEELLFNFENEICIDTLLINSILALLRYVILAQRKPISLHTKGGQWVCIRVFADF